MLSLPINNALAILTAVLVGDPWDRDPGQRGAWGGSPAALQASLTSFWFAVLAFGTPLPWGWALQRIWHVDFCQLGKQQHFAAFLMQLELAKGEPPESREPVVVMRKGGGSAAGGRVWPCRVAAGAEPPLHCHRDRGQWGQAGTCAGLGGGATSQGASRMWSSPWSSRFGRKSTEQKRHVLWRGSTYQFNFLHGRGAFWSWLFFSVFPFKWKKCLFFSVLNFQRGKMASPALKPSMMMHAQEMPKFRVSQSCYAYSPYTTLSAAAWPSAGSNLCGWQRQPHCPLAVNTGMWPSTFTIAVNQLVAFLIWGFQLENTQTQRFAFPNESVLLKAAGFGSSVQFEFSESLSPRPVPHSPVAGSPEPDLSDMWACFLQLQIKLGDTEGRNCLCCRASPWPA